MSFSPPQARLGVHMADWQGDLKLFDATLNLQRTVLDRPGLHRYLRQFPWMTAKTCLAIYWQALRLFLKRTPIFPIRPPTAPFALPPCNPRINAMKSPSLVSKTSLSTTHNLTSALLRRGVLRQLSQLKSGHLVVIETVNA